jgi:hypothetical protein
MSLSAMFFCIVLSSSICTAMARSVDPQSVDLMQEVFPEGGFRPYDEYGRTVPH